MATKSSKQASTMAELLARKATSGVRGFTRGQKVEAKILEITKKYVTFDVSGKSEGVLRDSYFGEARDLVSTLKVGDIVNATVIDPENRDGSVLLSLRHAANDKFWENLQRVKDNDEVITVVGRAASSKGIMVDVDSVSAFIPMSQLGKKAASNLEDLIDKRFKAKVLEVDKVRRKIMLSEKAVSEEAEMAEISDALSNLEENEVYEGVVREVTSFGAFVEITVGKGKKKTKVEGLVHVSELSWQKVKVPAEVISVGDKVQVKVVPGRMKKDSKLALSIRLAQDDPWTSVSKQFSVDQKLKGKVVRSSDFGVFVELSPGIEGLVHITKIPPATKLAVGDMVDVYIEEIDTQNHKISLGLVLTSKPVGYK